MDVLFVILIYFLLLIDYPNVFHFKGCPQTNGVCCKNSAFCCPHNFECGPKIGDCTPKSFNQTSLKQSQKVEINDKYNFNPTCSKPDGSSEPCPYRNGTCCGVHGYCW